MEKLLDQADALVLTAGDNDPPRPDFDIPEELQSHVTPNDLLQVLENPSKGKGWFAKRDIPAGTLLMVAKPIAWVMDCEEDDYLIDDEMEDMDDEEKISQEEEEIHVNELLVLELLKSIKENPSVWFDQISQLYPRDEADIKKSPVWNSKNEE